MALYLADTSAWSRSTRVAERWQEMIDSGSLAVCPPVKLELLYSAEGRREYRELAFDLQAFHLLPLDTRAASAAAWAQAHLAVRSQHRGPRPIDLLIAAIAEVNGATLLHYDRHFDAIARVTGQQMEWMAPRGSLD